MAANPASGRNLALYVHVPFCTRRCHYCDFAVTRSSDPPIQDWLKAVAEDMRQWSESPGSSRPIPIDTIFIGGGTPSLLGASGMEKLRSLLEVFFTWDPAGMEWTAEANPNSLTPDTALAWREIGVNRLSLGVQSFEDGALDWLGRLHDASEAMEAVERAQFAGFDNISVDLMFGLPREVRRDWRGDLERAASLGVAHVSTYGLTAEPPTPLGQHVRSGRIRMPDQERYAYEYMTAIEVLSSNDFIQYEVSSFAREGRECRHNWHYWIGSEYLGVGPSAHSFVDGRRIWNVRDWKAYRAAARLGESLREGHENPTEAERRLESLWLGLRTRAGIDTEEHRLPTSLRERWVGRDLATSAGNRLRLTPSGWLLLDELVAELVARYPEDEEI
jgi:oxygen-independent coproporphyrinogen-3 oxidase